MGSSCDFRKRKVNVFSFVVCGSVFLCLLPAGCAGAAGSVAQSSSNSPAATPTSTPAPSGGGVTGGRFLYVSGTSQNFNTANTVGAMAGFLEVFSLNASSGVLTPIAGSPFATQYSTTTDMALAPGGAFAYLLAQQFPAGTCCVGPTFLLVFSLDAASGAPTLKQALATNALEVSTIAVHPSGQFVYVTPYSGDAGTGGIGVFAVQADGTLAAGDSIPTQSTGSAILDPTGNFLYSSSDGQPVGNLGNNPCGLFNSNLWGFSVNQTTGALTAVNGSPFVFQRQLCVVGHAPQYITKQIDPAGQHLFVVDVGNATVTTFAIDPSSGALTALAGTSTAGAVSGFTASAIDPLGRFLYIGSLIDSFTGFSLSGNPASGVLPVLAGMPAQMSPLPNFDEGSTTVAIDPSGSFLFSNENGYTSAFSCCGPDDFVEFSIDPTTGALTQVPSTPIKLAGTAARIAAR
jgi:6-phosphogluconolactonase (cycloisomerase 2 family)